MRKCQDQDPRHSRQSRVPRQSRRNFGYRPCVRFVSILFFYESVPVTFIEHFPTSLLNPILAGGKQTVKLLYVLRSYHYYGSILNKNWMHSVEVSKPRVESSPLWCSDSCTSGKNDVKQLYSILFIYLFCMRVSFIIFECKETLHEQFNDRLVSRWHKQVWEYVTIVHHGSILACLTRHEISSLHPYPSFINLQLCKSAFSEVTDSHTETHTRAWKHTQPCVSSRQPRGL